MSSAPFFAWVVAAAMTVTGIKIAKMIATWALGLTFGAIILLCMAVLVTFALFLAGSVGWAWARDMSSFLAETSLSSLAMVWGWLRAGIQAGLGIWIGVMALTGAWAFAKSELSESFTWFCTFLVLVITSSSGVWLGCWVFKVMSGH